MIGGVKYRMFLVLAVAIFVACSHEKTPQVTIEQQIRQYTQPWIGVPYKLGGKTKEGIDCSALTQNIYTNVFHVELPRRVVEQRVEGLPVARDSLICGDLIVFRASLFGRPHIGVYLAHDEFIHASSSKGVMISSLTQGYWRRKYKTARRLLDPQGHLITNGVAVD